MRFKKFIILPILVSLYIFFVDSVIIPSITQSESLGSTGGVKGQKIGITATVSVLVTRPYLLGLIRLPIQVGNVRFAWMHEIFFFFIFVLGVIFVFMEL